MNFCAILTLLALLSQTCLAPPATAQAEVISGWIAGCDNENVCTAIRTTGAVDVLPADGDVPFLQIRHHPHRDATPEFTVIDPTAKARGASSEVVMMIGLASGLVHYSTAANGRFRDEDAWAILYGLRVGKPVLVMIGAKSGITIENAGFDSVLTYFDRQQELEGTPGALVTKPDGVQLDYAHPPPPDAETAMLSAFTPTQFRNWSAEYPESGPDDLVEIETDPAGGLVTIIRASTAGRDCGIFERWGHIGAANEFVLVERREMPVCAGIRPAHWIRTYRANTISPE